MKGSLVFCGRSIGVSILFDEMTGLTSAGGNIQIWNRIILRSINYNKSLGFTDLYVGHPCFVEIRL